ncbi:hypothetical protein K456DRAFT_59097 [Colletotrichum gloeosporioides 23]|nr:hypothetical protein K456DRAFT_59097 [Colletotrichum gloeosporioides 23]
MHAGLENDYEKKSACRAGVSSSTCSYPRTLSLALKIDIRFPYSWFVFGALLMYLEDDTTGRTNM